jgi:hypothetical protein
MEHLRAGVSRYQLWSFQVERYWHHKLGHIDTGNRALHSSLFLYHKLLGSFVRTTSLTITLTYPSEEQQSPAPQLPTPGPQLCCWRTLVDDFETDGERFLAGPNSSPRGWGNAILLRALNLLPPMNFGSPSRGLPGPLWALMTDASMAKRNIVRSMATE